MPILLFLVQYFLGYLSLTICYVECRKYGWIWVLKRVDNRDIVAFVQQLFCFSSKLNKFSVVWLYNNTLNENPTNHIPKTVDMGQYCSRPSILKRKRPLEEPNLWDLLRFFFFDKWDLLRFDLSFQRKYKHATQVHCQYIFFVTLFLFIFCFTNVE